jgi:hypothetical protein
MPFSGPDFAQVFVMPLWLMFGNAHPSDSYLNLKPYHM